MTSSARDLFAAAVREPAVDLARAALLMAADLDPSADPEHDAESIVADGLRRLDDLAALVPPDGRPVDRLRAALGDFRGRAADYEDVRSSLLPEVLRRKRGLPILLSVVWLEVAARCGIAAYGAGLPGHFIVGLGRPPAYEGDLFSSPDDDLIDPFAGGRSVGVAGRSVAAVRAWEPAEILQRMLANVRGWAARPDRVVVHLRAVELALLLPAHPVDLRRERAELLVRTGRFTDAGDEFEAYAEIVEAFDAAAAGTARSDAGRARAQLN